MFGQYEEIDPAEAAKADAIRSVGGFLGTLARAFLSGASRTGRYQYAGQEEGQQPQQQEPPCPDAQFGQRPEETPCAQRAHELQAKAAAIRARRGR